MENWKRLIDFDNYEVSDFGRIRKFETNKEVAICNSGNGYKLVKLNKEGLSKTYRVHRLVGRYFVHNPENKIYINHIDGNKCNNFYANLEWSTPLENTQHAYRTGLIIRKFGENATGAKLTDLQVLNIFVDKLSKTKEQIALEYNITRSNVSLIHSGKSRRESLERFLDIEEIDAIISIKIDFPKITKKVYELNRNKEVIKIYDSIKDIMDELNITNKSSVTQVASGKKKSIYGRYFLYEDKFTQEDANHRDLVKEREVLEGK